MLPTIKDIQKVLARKDEIGMHAIGRALNHLLSRQTYFEERNELTKNANSIGFAVNDAKRGTSMAKFYRKRNFLTAKQVAYWQYPCKKGSTVSRIAKYSKQLRVEAIIKTGWKNCKIPVDMEFVSLTEHNWLMENAGEWAINWHIRENKVFVDTKETAVLIKLALAK